MRKTRYIVYSNFWGEIAETSNKKLASKLMKIYAEEMCKNKGWEIEKVLDERILFSNYNSLLIKEIESFNTIKDFKKYISYGI